MKDFNPEEFNWFRKRAIGLILATDMAKHAADLTQLTSILADHNIKDGENVGALVPD